MIYEQDTVNKNKCLELSEEITEFIEELLNQNKDMVEEETQQLSDNLLYLKLCGFEISKTKYDDGGFMPYKEITLPNEDVIFRYTPEYEYDISGPYGNVDMLPTLKEDVERSFGLTLPTTEELYNQNKDGE